LRENADRKQRVKDISDDLHDLYGGAFQKLAEADEGVGETRQ
jgi:hypothetical protein